MVAFPIDIVITLRIKVVARSNLAGTFANRFAVKVGISKAGSPDI
jgi:hypothetical protein